MIKPTAEEIRNVRRWECATQGHRFDVTLCFGGQDPQRIVCVNCGESWAIDVSDIVHLPALISERLQISTSEGRRLIQQGGVKINSIVTHELDVPMAALKDVEVQVGKRRFFRVSGYSLFVLITSHEHEIHSWCMNWLPLMPLPMEKRRDLRLELADGKVLLKYRLSDGLSETRRQELESKDEIEQIEIKPGDVAIVQPGLREER